jgi:ketosteroid isomerase-like protein
MSERNIETVRGAFDAFLLGDLESAMEVFHPAVEWDVSMRVDGRVFHGHDGVRQGIATWLSAWEDYRIDVEEYVDAGDDVIVLATEGGRGKGSGIESEQRVKFTWTLADGKVTRVKITPRD